MFAKCLVHPGSTKDVFICSQVEPPSDDSTFEVPAANVWNTNCQIDPMTYGDIGMLPQTSIPCVLDYLRHRYMKNQIYSTADPLMVAINPYKDLGNATDEVIRKYINAPDLLKMPPHVFYTARKALENLYDYKFSQTIIVSGESGTGKTQSTTQMLRFFASTKSDPSSKGLDLRIQTAVMAANPVLEAFGNAKTIRNNNSSRFGRFMQLDVAPSGGIRYGSVVTFLLEKSRIVTQDENERSYHIFYQFLKGASQDTKRRYKLLPLSEYKYLNPKCYDVATIDDVKDYNLVCESLKNMGLSESEIDTVWSLLSGVLLMGNVEFVAESRDGIDDAAKISNMSTFKDACDLLFINSDDLERELTSKVTHAGGSEIVSPRRVADAEVLKCSLSKGVYEKVFVWLVRSLNETIEPPESFDRFIGLLDIFGFEVFKNNSLEQLFINITNEMLQTNFINIVFKREAALYAEEGIASPSLEYESNVAIIDLLCSKNRSVLSILEDQCLAPGGADSKIVSTCNSSFSEHAKYKQCKVAGDSNFTIVHTIGPIQYCSSGFILKNKDVLTGELITLVNESSNPVVSTLFANVPIVSGKLAKGMLIGSQFMSQLDSLMTLINSTDSHFIRCITPNEQMKPLTWNSVKVLIQLHALSVIEALQLRKLGYSYRRDFKDFVDQYRFLSLAVSNDKSLDDKTKAQKLIETTGLESSAYKLGKTKMFLTQRAANDLTNMQREKLAVWGPLVDALEALMNRWKSEEGLKGTMKDIVRLQAHLRKLVVGARVTPKAQEVFTRA